MKAATTFWRQFPGRQLDQFAAALLQPQAQDAPLPVQHQGAGDRVQGRPVEAARRLQVPAQGEEQAGRQPQPPTAPDLLRSLVLQNFAG